MKKEVVFSFLIFLLNNVGFAQEKVDWLNEKSAVILSDSTNNLTGITVTATRKNTANWSVPYSVSVVNKSQLAAFGFRSTPEALSGTAGVFVQKTNHGGGSPFIRGLTGNQTLLLMDGIRLNNATYRYGPNQYLNTIDPSIISKIEVARGTGSVQYGSDALGGVIQLFTQSPEFIKGKALHSTFRSRVTSQDMEYGGRAEMEYQSNNLAILGGYSGVKFGDLVGGDTTGRQNPSGYQQRAFDFKLKYQLAPGAILTVAHQWLRQKEVPLYHKVKLENFKYYFFDPQQRQMSYAKLVFTGKNKLLDKISIISSLQKSFERREYQKNGNSNQFTEEDRVNTWGNVLDVFSVISKNWTANSGVEYYHDQVNSNKQQQSVITGQTVSLRGLYPNNASSGNFSISSLKHFTKGKFDIVDCLLKHSLNSFFTAKTLNYY